MVCNAVHTGFFWSSLHPLVIFFFLQYDHCFTLYGCLFCYVSVLMFFLCCPLRPFDQSNWSYCQRKMSLYTFVLTSFWWEWQGRSYSYVSKKTFIFIPFNKVDLWTRKRSSYHVIITWACYSSRSCGVSTWPYPGFPARISNWLIWRH